MGPWEAVMGPPETEFGPQEPQMGPLAALRRLRCCIWRLVWGVTNGRMDTWLDGQTLL